MNTINVLLVEDTQIIRLGLRAVLKTVQGIELVGECDNGQQALDYLTQAFSNSTPDALSLQFIKPHLILMDLEMPVMDGIEATRLIKLQYPEVRILVLTSHQEEAKVLPALAAGADGYTLKNTEAPTLVNMILAIASGASWFAPEVSAMVLKQIQNYNLNTNHQPFMSPLLPVSSSTQNPYGLSPKEQEVLGLVVYGYSNNEIANTMFISINTAKAHVGRLIEKMLVNDRVQVAVKAVQEGLVTAGHKNDRYRA